MVVDGLLDRVLSGGCGCLVGWWVVYYIEFLKGGILDCVLCVVCVWVIFLLCVLVCGLCVF